MSKLRRIAQQDRFFFVTTNIAKDVKALSAAERTLLLATLDECRTKLKFKVFAFVVMPTHAHLLLEPMGSALSPIIRDFKSHSALAINYLRSTHGPLWQSRFFDSICRHARNFSEKMEYIHRNPVVAGLTESPEEWEWSSAGKNIVFIPDFVDVPADRNTLLWPAPWR